MLFVVPAYLLSRNRQVYHTPTENVLHDGLTLTPRQAGKMAIWDVTVTDTFAKSYLNSTSITASSAAEQAPVYAMKENNALALSQTLISIAIETMGSIYRFKSIIFFLFCRSRSPLFSHLW